VASERRSKKPADDPAVAFSNLRAWRAWLKKNHASASEVWVLLSKKGNDTPSVTRADAVDEALCWGWIDGQARSLGERTWMQRFTPRRPRSIWAKINRDKVAALIAAGRMKPPGLAEVERAKADGRWDAAYDSPKTATVPDDLAAALAKKPRAKASFAKLDARNRYAVLFRIHHAKKPETRARRIAQFVDMLVRGELPHRGE
jgi:uncharacterized protein YdeI (YjbR/CyaY-like superfamily)